VQRMSAVIGLAIASVGLAGCATSGAAQRGQDQLQVQVAGLQSQVAALTSHVEELRSRQQALEGRAWDQGVRVSSAAETRTARRAYVVLTAKELQLALQRAGYYQGPMDGKIGPKTRTAIKLFQAANGLVADGVAGHKTMVALHVYLTPMEGGS